MVREFKGSGMSAATEQLTPPLPPTRRKEREWRVKRERERTREREREKGTPPAGESPSLDRLSLNRTPSRYGARVVTQSHPGLDALTLSPSLFTLVLPSHRISPTLIHSYSYSPIQTWIYCSDTPAALAAVAPSSPCC